jgi:hypothetical protein
VIVVAALVLIAQLWSEAPSRTALKGGYGFYQGELWAAAGSAGTPALIDTGTTTSVFPKDWPFSSPSHSQARVTTVFGERMLALRRVGPTRIGGRRFEGEVFTANLRNPHIGDDFIFGSGNVLLSVSGLKFDVDYDASDAIACVGWQLSFAGGGIEGPLAKVELMLTIDGVEQRAFLDTGRSAALAATAALPMPKEKLFPRPDILLNGFGDWKFSPYFARHAVLSLGGERASFDYHHYYTDRSDDAPFVVGAEMLKHYSILIDRKKHRACFFKP